MPKIKVGYYGSADRIALNEGVHDAAVIMIASLERLVTKGDTHKRKKYHKPLRVSTLVSVRVSINPILDVFLSIFTDFYRPCARRTKVT